MRCGTERKAEGETMTPTETQPAYCLWFRSDRGHQWQLLASADSTLALTSVLAQHRQSGESIILPTGEHPDDRRKPR